MHFINPDAQSYKNEVYSSGLQRDSRAGVTKKYVNPDAFVNPPQSNYNHGTIPGTRRDRVLPVQTVTDRLNDAYRRPPIVAPLLDIPIFAVISKNAHVSIHDPSSPRVIEPLLATRAVFSDGHGQFKGQSMSGAEGDLFGSGRKYGKVFPLSSIEGRRFV